MQAQYEVRAAEVAADLIIGDEVDIIVAADCTYYKDYITQLIRVRAHARQDCRAARPRSPGRGRGPVNPCIVRLTTLRC